LDISCGDKKKRPRRAIKTMCESNVYFKKDDKEDLILKDVVFIRPEKDSVFIEDILGESKTIDGKITLIDLVGHKVIISPS
jgi:predicted RNA-binding protein